MSFVRQNNFIQNNYYNSSGQGCQNGNSLMGAQRNQNAGMMAQLQQMEQVLDMMGQILQMGDGGCLSPEAMGLNGGGDGQGCCCNSKANNFANAFGGPNEAQKSDDEKVKFDYEGGKKGKKGKEGQPEKFKFEGNPDQLKGLLEAARANKTKKAA